MNYRMTIYPAIEAGNPSVAFMFETAEQMICAKNACADLLLFIQDGAHVMKDYSNEFILEKKAGLEWEEYDEKSYEVPE